MKEHKDEQDEFGKTRKVYRGSMEVHGSFQRQIKVKQSERTYLHDAIAIIYQKQ